MAIVDEINKDLEKMGGDASGQTVEEAMDKFGDEIIEKIGEATELPEVTAEDEGDVLTVDSEGNWGKGEIPKELPEVTSADAGKILSVDSNGNWVATTAQPSGNLDVMICNFTLGDNDYLVCDKTVQEIIEAYNSGKTVIGRYLYDSDTYKQYMLSYISPEWQGEDYDHKIQFINVHINDDGPNTQYAFHADAIGYRVAGERWEEGWYNGQDVILNSDI